MAELSYNNENGDSVFTSQYLKNRGSCCQSTCLHCPYGLTLKSFGLKFQSVEKSQWSRAQELINLHQKPSQDIAASLLSSAFGKPVTQLEINDKNQSEFSFIILKNVICGVAHHGRFQVNKIFLAKHFDQQGIDKDIVQDYFLDRSK